MVRRSDRRCLYESSFLFPPHRISDKLLPASGPHLTCRRRCHFADPKYSHANAKSIWRLGWANQFFSDIYGAATRFFLFPKHLRLAFPETVDPKSSLPLAEDFLTISLYLLSRMLSVQDAGSGHHSLVDDIFAQHTL